MPSVSPPLTIFLNLTSWELSKAGFSFESRDHQHLQPYGYIKPWPTWSSNLKLEYPIMSNMLFKFELHKIRCKFCLPYNTNFPKSFQIFLNCSYEHSELTYKDKSLLVADMRQGSCLLPHSRPTFALLLICSFHQNQNYWTEALLLGATIERASTSVPGRPQIPYTRQRVMPRQTAIRHPPRSSRTRVGIGINHILSYVRQ